MSVWWILLGITDAWYPRYGAETLPDIHAIQAAVPAVTRWRSVPVSERQAPWDNWVVCRQCGRAAVSVRAISHTEACRAEAQRYAARWQAATTAGLLSAQARRDG